MLKEPALYSVGQKHRYSLYFLLLSVMAHVDVISDILKAALDAYPDSRFIQSLAHQYLVRGWLSKKQMEGLFDKASKAEKMSPGKLATLQAQINKMPTRFKTEKPEIKTTAAKDERIGELISEILNRYPQHKRILFLQSKLQCDEIITPAERAELEKLHKLLVKT